MTDKTSQEISGKTYPTINKQGCSNIVGFTNKAEPRAGAIAYFNAAIYSGYTHLFFVGKLGQYYWLDVETAKTCYDKRTGKIAGIKAYRKTSWFCKEIDGKIPPSNVPPTSSCKMSCLKYV